MMAPMICSRAWRLLAVLMVLLCLPVLDGMAGAGAAARSSAKVRRAKKLFTQAEIKYRLGEFAAALSLYKKALALARRPSLVFNIAQCHRFLEHPKKALFYYQLYLSEWKRASPGTNPPNHAEVQGFVVALREKLQRPRLLIEGDPRGAEVLIDGRIVGKLPMDAPLTVEPGDHQLRVKARGYRTYRRLISLRLGQQFSRRIRLRRRVRRRSAAWLVTGIAAAALTVGAEVSALVFTKKTNDQYDDTPEFEQYRNAAIISHVAAGAMAVTAGLSFLLYYRSGERPAEASTGSGRPPRFVLVPSHDGAVFSATGTF